MWSKCHKTWSICQWKLRKTQFKWQEPPLYELRLYWTNKLHRQMGDRQKCRLFERDRLSLFTYNNEARYLSSYSWGSTERSLNKHIFEATLCPRLKEFQNGVNIWVGGLGLWWGLGGFGWHTRMQILEDSDSVCGFHGGQLFLHTTLVEFVIYFSRSSVDQLTNE